MACSLSGGKVVYSACLPGQAARRLICLVVMAPTTVFDRATIRHNLTEFKLRWISHVEQWKAENRPATESKAAETDCSVHGDFWTLATEVFGQAPEFDFPYMKLTRQECRLLFLPRNDISLSCFTRGKRS